MDLKKRWMAWFAPAFQTQAEEAFQRLQKHYNEKGRAYHNLDHVAQCLSELDKVGLTYPRTVEWALWYHDAIYDPKRKDNEEESAYLAAFELSGLGVPRTRRSDVERLILLTKHGKAPPKSLSGYTIIDIDLHTLGRPSQEYDAYAKAIRQEYEWVPEPDYIKGRTAVLQSFLNRRHIYYTDRFRQLYEQSARQNLTEEIRRLNQ